MELDKRFGTYRGILIEIERHADREKVVALTSDSAVAAELGLMDCDGSGRWEKLVNSREISACYRETWWGELEGHTVQLMRDEGDQYMINVDVPGVAERWNLGLVEPRDPYTAIGMVVKDAVTNIRCKRGSFDL